SYTGSIKTIGQPSSPQSNPIDSVSSSSSSHLRRQRDRERGKETTATAQEHRAARKKDFGVIEALSPEHACGFGMRAAPSSGSW
ncbi:hypothetical protein ACTAOK_25990, partial [Klebsiella pneumoniae]|uniref:hypothetical protein n=1 Tax=Klebsiella pneumoniae TaxID=573 RepID=UPI003F47EBD5